MRKITKLATDAFTNGYDFNQANTQVVVALDNTIKMYLHNNLIAEKKDDKLFLTDAGWKTNTTKDRLNGIMLAHGITKIVQKAGVWYMNK